MNTDWIGVRVLRWGFLPCALVVIFPGTAGSQSKASAPVKTPDVIVEFLKHDGFDNPDVFYARAKEMLWSVYPHDESLKNELVAYVKSAPDGPGLGFAGIALIPFHDPATVSALMNRVQDRRTSPATRWCFLNVAPYILAIGDNIYDEEGALGQEEREIARELTEFADEAARRGLGRAHAAQLRAFFDEGKENPDYELAVWHLSAYLIGTVDARDRESLVPLFTPHLRSLPNLMLALSLASNRDFEREIHTADPSQITEEFLNQQAAKALDWWKGYLALNPSGDWMPGILSGFREAGYEIDADLSSEKSLQAILLAMESENRVTRYNAYRLLNHIFKTHFDLERIFNSDKYALSFLEPNTEKGQSEDRLKNYWRERLMR